MITCRQAWEHLVDYLEGTALPEIRRAIDEHVQKCTCCPDFVKSYQKTSILCQKALKKPVPEGVSERLLSVLRDKTSALKSRK